MVPSCLMLLMCALHEPRSRLHRILIVSLGKGPIPRQGLSTRLSDPTSFARHSGTESRELQIQRHSISRLNLYDRATFEHQLLRAWRGLVDPSSPKLTTMNMPYNGCGDSMTQSSIPTNSEGSSNYNILRQLVMFVW